MRTLLILVNLLLFFQYALSRDFYMGMFSKGDFLVAQDNVYKDRRPYSRVIAEYGRKFKCKITYFRVVDRLGMGSGPIVRILKGGLQKEFIVIRLRSGYNLPISVNVYVGCQNKNLKHLIPPIKVTKPKPTTTERTEDDEENDLEPSQNSTDASDGVNQTSSQDATTNAASDKGNDTSTAEPAADPEAKPEADPDAKPDTEG